MKESSLSRGATEQIQKTQSCRGVAEEEEEERHVGVLGSKMVDRS